MTPWNNIIRLLIPPRMRGSLLIAILDSLLHRTIQQARQAEAYRDNTVSLYSNIAQRQPLQNLLNSQFPGHNIWIQDTATGTILLLERPGLTPNHTHRRLAASTAHGPAHSACLILPASALAFDGNDLIIHHTGLSPIQQEELRHLVRRILFLGVTFEIATP